MAKVVAGITISLHGSAGNGLVGEGGGGGA
jgi:hypothetical protein